MAKKKRRKMHFRLPKLVANFKPLKPGEIRYLVPQIKGGVQWL